MMKLQRAYDKKASSREQQNNILEPAQYKSHFCCSFSSLLSIALNVEYTGKAMPTEQLKQQ